VTTIVSIDGVIVDRDRAMVSVFDRGFLYGDGCFEVLRTWGGVAVDLEAHMDRLSETLAFLALKSLPRAVIARAVEAAIAAAGAGEHRVRIVVTRGPGSLATKLVDLPAGHTIVIVEPLPAASTEGISVVVVDWPLAARPGRGHKTLAYLDHVLARDLARSVGADEGLRLDESGAVVEGATSNVFVVSGGTVATPMIEGGVLPGVVRGRVLAVCSQLGIVTENRRVGRDELFAVDEVFVTSSIRGVVAVTQIDGVVLPTGPITTRIATTYVTQMMSLVGTRES